MAQEQYSLGNSYGETTRLIAQHYLWRETLGFHIHPSVEFATERPRIADIGTGTGLWLLDIASILPKADFVGLDVSDSGFPDHHWLPPNVNFAKFDAFEEPPQHLCGKFDLVHLRLIHLVVREDEPTDIISNASKLLKTGGFIQWEEYDPEAQKTISSGPAVQTSSLELLAGFQKSQRPYSWIAKLPATIKQHEFALLDVKRLHEPRWRSQAWVETHLVLGENYASATLDRRGSDGTGEGLRRLLQEVHAEVRQGGSIEQTLQIVLGQKSS